MIAAADFGSVEDEDRAEKLDKSAINSPGVLLMPSILEKAGSDCDG